MTTNLKPPDNWHNHREYAPLNHVHGVGVGVKTFLQPNEPLSVESSEGDLWYDSDNGNLLHRFESGAWVEVPIGEGGVDSSIIGARVFTQGTPPGSEARDGDLWFDSATYNLLYRRIGGVWVRGARLIQAGDGIATGNGISQLYVTEDGYISLIKIKETAGVNELSKIELRDKWLSLSTQTNLPSDKRDILIRTDGVSVRNPIILRTGVVDNYDSPTYEGWHIVGDPGEPAFQNGWTGNATYKPAFRKDAVGNVHVRGVVNPGSSSTTVFTLPDGYRPNGIPAVTMLADANPSSTVAKLDFFDTGAVRVIYKSGTPTAVNLTAVFSYL